MGVAEETSSTGRLAHRAVKRAGFATKNMRVTPYLPDEMHSAGDHGVTHIPRSQGWPVRPHEISSFLLVPK